MAAQIIDTALDDELRKLLEQYGVAAPACTPADPHVFPLNPVWPWDVPQAPTITSDRVQQ